jgi:hypothetical protein
VVYSALSDIQDDLKILALMLEISLSQVLLIVKQLHFNKAGGWMSERRLQPGLKTAKLQSSIIAWVVSQQR